MKDYSKVYYNYNTVISSNNESSDCTTAVLMNAVSINKEAFINNDNLGEVLFGESLKSIGDDAFNGCMRLRFRLPNNLEYVGKRAFAGICSNCSIIIPQSINKIDTDCFMYSKLNVVYVEEGTSQLLDIFHGAEINEIYLPSTIEYIDTRNYDAFKKVLCYRYSSIYHKCEEICKDKLIVRGDIN